MESRSNQAFASDDTERGMRVLSYKDSKLVDDEVSVSFGLCNGEVDHVTGVPFDTSPTADDSTEPYTGMEFKSREAAREFYIAYGRRTGFTVRIHHNRRSRINNMVIGQDFVCSKEGFREKKYVYRKDRVLPSPPVTREGCPAMLRLALRDEVKWVVTKFVKEHNHTLMSPGKVPWRASTKRLISEDDKDRKIHELTVELHNERQRCRRRCAAYQEQLRMLLNFVEQHTDHLSRKVQDLVKNIEELEDEESEDLDYR